MHHDTTRRSRSLQELYLKLTSTAPHFIKCVKTNQVYAQPSL
jgi:myosin heavy subunit